MLSPVFIKITPLRVLGLWAGLGLCLANDAQAQTIWDGPSVTFAKADGADPTQPENQDRITDTVWLTRANTQGIFNIAQEAGFANASPVGTEWAFGTTDDIESLEFQTWVNWHERNPPSTVGRDAVLHLIEEDIYIDIRFTGWTQMQGGGFAYTRSSAPTAVEPEIAVQPVNMTSVEGSNAFFSVQASGGELSYQWRKDGVDLPGETNPGLFISDVSSDDAGSYTVIVTNAGGSVESSAAGLSVTASGSVRFGSLSTRAQVGTGDNILIPGFFISGSGDKNLLVRAVGEKLADFGVTGNLGDPTLGVTEFGEETSLAFNDDWPDAPDQDAMEAARASVFAFALAPLTNDSSLLVSVPAGGYTAQAAGADQATGVALVELFDTDPPGSTATLVSISARAQVGTGNDILIPGISIQGDVAMTVLIRAVGPQLAEFGVAGALEDPQMTLARSLSGGGSEVIGSNDDWEGNPDLEALEAARIQVSAFQLDAGSRDAAMLVALNPGSYTVQVSGKDGGTGVALVELFRVAPEL